MFNRGIRSGASAPEFTSSEDCTRSENLGTSFEKAGCRRTGSGNYGSTWERGLVRIEKRAKIAGRDILASLSEDRMARPGVELAMIRNSERFIFPGRTDSSQFDVAPPLRKNEETELLKN